MFLFDDSQRLIGSNDDFSYSQDITVQDSIVRFNVVAGQTYYALASASGSATIWCRSLVSR